MNVYAIAGRKYRPIQTTTLELDHHNRRITREAGLDDLRKRPDETPTDFAARLLDEIYASGKAFELLGGLLVLESVKDEDWTPELAKGAAQVFRKVTVPEEKAVLTGVLANLYISFLGHGLTSSSNSLIASEPAQPASVSTQSA